jgi:uncharacterized coiled-coil protein SlyX
MRIRLNSKILYTIFIAVTGLVLTIGAASAVTQYFENIEIDNGVGDSSLKVTSSTGDSKIILEDQGKRTFSFQATDGKKKFEIADVTNSYQPRLSINQNGDVGIGTPWPQAKPDVKGDIHTNSNVDVVGNLNVDGIITGSYIANLEATIAALEARIVALEASMAINEPMIITNEAMIATHDTMITSNSAMIATHDTMIAANSAAIEDLEAGIPPQTNACDTDGDGAITPQEMLDYMNSVGYTPAQTIGLVSNKIANVESSLNVPNPNVILDSDLEVNEFNGIHLIPQGHSACPLPGN